MGKSITDCLSGSVQVGICDSQNHLINFGAYFLEVTFMASPRSGMSCQPYLPVCGDGSGEPERDASEAG